MAPTTGGGKGQGWSYSTTPGAPYDYGSTWTPRDGWKPATPTKASSFTGSALDDVLPRDPKPSEAHGVVRYCAARLQSGEYCPKPIRSEGGTYCDVHYYELLDGGSNG